jgi:hypothetical protein
MIPDDPDPDRDRGILTPHDRAFLRADPGEGVRADMSNNAIRQKRHGIRQRFKHGIADLGYLTSLEGQSVELIRESGDDDYQRGKTHGQALMALLWLFRESFGREFFINQIEYMLAEDVIAEYAQEHTVLADVQVDVSVDVSPPEECPPLDQVLTRLNAGEEIPEAAHWALRYADVHPNPDEYFASNPLENTDE